MLISLDKNFVFIAAGKTGTSSVSLSLLPHLTTDFAQMPYSMALDMPTHPEIESLLGAGADNVSGTDTIKGLGLLHAAAAADAPFEMAYTNKQTGYAFRTSDLNDFKHLPARTARRVLGESFWQSAFRFAFVRNPWDWVLSNYVYKQRPENVEPMDTEKVLWVRDNVKLRQLPIPYRTQHAFLCDEDGQVKLDFVGRFENFSSDFAKVANHLELGGDLGHLNENEKDSRSDVRSLFTDEAFELVGELWAVDIETFGYGDFA